MKTRKISELLSFALAAIIAIGAIASALRFPGAGEAPSGPGSFPLFLGLVMAGLSVCGIVLSLRNTLRPGRSRGVAEDEDGMSREKQMLILTAATALYLLIMPLFGFISGTAVFCMGMLMVLGYSNPVRALAAGFIAAYALYAVFGVLMNVVLPKGWIG